MMNKRTLFIVHAAVIAALYVVLTLLAATFNLANGAIQVRFSEALTILPYFTPAGIYGVTIGCFLSNILTGCAIPDIIFGTLATLIGAIGTYILKKNRWLAPLPPIVSNMIIIPVILTYAYHIPGGIPFLMLTVGAGEVISCYVIGEILLSA
ncbi:MAG: QueT transporter family protein, partial [Lachnospiraceae bacterium]|nr:QueT transporter family protein [Lachnospiraceae bacterium]